eukprot:m.144749 g.144749  ORF g.144749 m.144749 type:complete len:221 (-) comp14105_c0_seq4:680-1342(-)
MKATGVCSLPDHRRKGLELVSRLSWQGRGISMGYVMDVKTDTSDHRACGLVVVTPTTRIEELRVGLSGKSSHGLTQRTVLTFGVLISHCDSTHQMRHKLHDVTVCLVQILGLWRKTQSLQEHAGSSQLLGMRTKILTSTLVCKSQTQQCRYLPERINRQGKFEARLKDCSWIEKGRTAKGEKVWQKLAPFLKSIEKATTVHHAIVAFLARCVLQDLKRYQ